MSESAFQDLRDTDVDEAAAAILKLDSMNHVQRAGMLIETMPGLATMGTFLAEGLRFATEREDYEYAYLTGFARSAALVWLRLEELAQNPDTDAGDRALQAQRILKEASLEDLRLIAQELLETIHSESSANQSGTDETYSEHLASVADDYPVLADARGLLTRGSLGGEETEELEEIASGAALFFLALVRELESRGGL
jgi:hypothetical protein